MVKMIVTAWKGGRKKGQREGGSYGFKVRKEDRNKHFRRTWDHVHIKLPNKCEANAKIGKNSKPSFWRNCPELVRFVIRDWLEKTGRLPWKKGFPPKFELIHVKDNKFRLGKEVKRKK